MGDSTADQITDVGPSEIASEKDTGSRTDPQWTPWASSSAQPHKPGYQVQTYWLDIGVAGASSQGNDPPCNSQGGHAICQIMGWQQNNYQELLDIQCFVAGGSVGFDNNGNGSFPYGYFRPLTYRLWQDSENHFELKVYFKNWATSYRQCYFQVYFMPAK